MQDSLPVLTVLGCGNSVLREGLKHILAGTRYTLHPDDLSQKGSSAPYSSGEAPLLFVIDVNLYPHGIPDVIRSLKGQHSGARVVILADRFDLGGMVAALQAGADGYCLTTTRCEALIKYLDLTLLGEVVFPSAMVLSAMSSLEDDMETEVPSAKGISVPSEMAGGPKLSPVRSLSSREAEILQCLMQGAPNKVIARRLEVAEATVKVHIKAILRKIRVANRTQAAMWAVNHLAATNQDQPWAGQS